MTTKKQATEIKITSNEIRNICSQYEFNENCKLTDDDRSYSIKKAMSKLEKSDFIIYCLFMELGTKTEVAEVLGISRISATRLIKNIETEIKQHIDEDTNRLTDNPIDNSIRN